MSLLELFSRKKACTLLTNVEGRVVEKYEYFKNFLDCNKDALNFIAELEQTYFSGQAINLPAAEQQTRDLLKATRNLTTALNGLADGRYGALEPVLDRLEAEVGTLFQGPAAMDTGDLVLPLTAVTSDMVAAAGGKATNLATAANVLGLPAPPGFVVTAAAFRLFLEENGLVQPIAMALKDFSLADPDGMEAVSAKIQAMILKAPVPPALAAAIQAAYEALAAAAGGPVRLAMRSSAVGEDTEASFAGQYVTVLNVLAGGLMDAYKEVLASKYSAWAIAYRMRYGLSDRETPMGVAGIVMVDAAASGVLYTVEPSRPESGLTKLTSIWGLGEHLVSGEAAPDVFFIDRQSRQVKERRIGRKAERLVNLPEGGTRLEAVAAGQDAPSLDDAMIQLLVEAGLKLEGYFGVPQDVEWAIDGQGCLFILQSRPLGLTTAAQSEVKVPKVAASVPIVLQGGQSASPGIATGQAFVSPGPQVRHVPADAILVARTATPQYAALIGRVRGIIAEIGSAASHLASVAREFGVPMLVNAPQATTVLRPGQEISLIADTATVYEGIVPALAEAGRAPKKLFMESPAHRRLRAVLDLLAPLNLTDPHALEFTPQGCHTLHDVIRFAHETAMREMFRLSAEKDRGMTTARLKSNIPLMLYLIDLGGGLRFGLTTCDELAVDDIESLPLKALWRGLSHPGITWKGAINFGVGNFMSLMAQGAMRDASQQPGGDSYALISEEYLNLSAKFGYHFANLDTLMSSNPSQNYVSLQFSGGVGSVYGRSLRISFLAQVLRSLGYGITVRGDLLEAILTGYDQPALEGILDQTGRLLACSRLLDMAITDEAEVGRLTEKFFRGDYNFLDQAPEGDLPGFYTHEGAWHQVREAGREIILEDGSGYPSSLSTGLTTVMGVMLGHTYLEFLDAMGAYFYFPLAIAKESDLRAGTLRVQVQPRAGKIDQAGGLAFGLRNVGNYFVLRVNALESNFTLFEFVNNKRWLRHQVPVRIKTGQWCEIKVEISGNRLLGYLDGELRLEYEASRSLSGHVGLWTKADSVTAFAGLEIQPAA